MHSTRLHKIWYIAKIEPVWYFFQILEAHDLPIKDFLGSSDPYVKVHLLPDRKRKCQTKVHRKNLNPIFNETFIFRLVSSSSWFLTLHQVIFSFSVSPSRSWAIATCSFPSTTLTDFLDMTSWGRWEHTFQLTEVSKCRNYYALCLLKAFWKLSN